MGGLGNEFHYFSKCQNSSMVKMRKELQTKIQPLTKYLKLTIKIINMLENFYTTYLRNIKNNLIA